MVTIDPGAAGSLGEGSPDPVRDEEVVKMRSRTRRAVGIAVVAGGAVLLRPGTHANRMVRQQIDIAGQRRRYLGGQLRGISYRLRDGRPDPDVIDTVRPTASADRSGGLEEATRPSPHPRHGRRPRRALAWRGRQHDDAAEIERAVAAAPGVVGVESYLHTGLTKGDTRPSEGHAAQPVSDVFGKQLFYAARDPPCSTLRMVDDLPPPPARRRADRPNPLRRIPPRRVSDRHRVTPRVLGVSRSCHVRRCR